MMCIALTTSPASNGRAAGRAATSPHHHTTSARHVTPTHQPSSAGLETRATSPPTHQPSLPHHHPTMRNGARDVSRAPVAMSHHIYHPTTNRGSRRDSSRALGEFF